MEGYAAVILAGGVARRLDGADKPELRVGGRPLLDRVLAAVADADVRIVVGPPRDLPPGVLTVQEQPPGGGPVAAVATGIAALPDEVPLVALLGADLPFLTEQAVCDLRVACRAETETVAPPEAACYVDSDGRPQYLCAVWRTEPLRQRIAALHRLDGVPLKRLYATAQVAELTSDVTPPPWYDCDTPEQLRRAEAWLEESRHERSR